MPDRFTELADLARRRDSAFADITRSECLDAARAFYEARRAEIRERHERGASGADIVADLTETADTLLIGVFNFGLYQAPNRRSLLQRVSLCAQGGYGRAQLNPYSDLDIGLIYEGKPTEDLEALNTFLVPFLWDIGYKISYVSRDVREAVTLARKDTQVLTSYLECRLLYGGSAPFARLRMSIRDLAPAAKAARFAQMKLRERSDSLPEEYRDLYASEPNLKEGAGGLRDYHVGLWLLTVAFGVKNLDEAVSQQLLSQEERLELDDALDFIWRVRNELHFHAGKADDRLSYANQRHVAKAFGYHENTTDAATRFMEDYYGAARKLRRFLQKAARAGRFDDSHRLLDTPPRHLPDFTVEDGELYAGMTDSHWFEENPPRLMAVFWECARRDVALSPPTERLIEQNLQLVNDTFRENDLVRRYFIAICNRPLQAGRVLRQMAQAGLLARYIPEFADIQGVLRYADFHTYPVDEHTLRAIEAVARVPELEGPIGNALQRALEHLRDPYLLIVALLFHDLGKAEGEEHVEEGVRLTNIIAQRIGMEKDDAERVAFLVRHHLLMSHIGLYRDADDLQTVQEFADIMKTDDRLRALFLLTYADMSAVGPNVWNEWKGALLLKLYLRADKFLENRGQPLNLEYWRLPKVQDITNLLPAGLQHRVERHIMGFGERYFMAFRPDEIAEHIACIAEAEESGIAIRCIRSDETDTSEVVISTRDHPGLFAEVTGCFASQLIDVTNAALYTRDDGLALDSFTVVNAARRRPLTQTQCTAVERVLFDVLAGGAPVEEYLEQSRRRLYGLLQEPVPVPTRINFDNESSRTHTVLDIEAGDRTGLLYDIARAMTELGVDISNARIVTDVRRVRDSFYISLNGGKIVETDLQDALRERLKQVILARPPLESKPPVESKGGTL